MKFDELKKVGQGVVSNKKYQWAATIVVLIVILMMSSSIRVSNWNLLTDSTTGEKIPLALDPLYFLRVAETIVENDGVLPEFDEMRFNPERKAGWHPEIMPRVIVWMHNTANIFGDYSLRNVDILSPVIFFGAGFILFFFLTYVLTKKKSLALLASAFLAFNPAYLYRTMAGFSDHESIGMVGFFLAILIYSLGLLYIEKKKTGPLGAGIFGAVVAMATLLNYASWSGVTFFLFIIIPLSFFLLWIFKTRDGSKEFAAKGILFYASWVVFSMLLAPLFNRTISNIWNLLLSSTNIVSLAILGFIIVDFAVIFVKPDFVRAKFRILYSLMGSVILGFVALFAIGKNPFSLVISMIARLIKPFGSGRFGTTVAENAQPFLQDWINNVGLYIFWLFLLGSILFGVYLARKIKDLKHSIIFGALYVFMIVGIVFSKYSGSSIFNGSNFISQAFYVVSLFSFWVYFFYIYLNEKFEWTARDVVIFALIFYTIVAGRAAARVFFAITPFVCFMAAYFVVKLYSEWTESKEEILKMVMAVIFVISIIISWVALSSSFTSINNIAEGTGPSANVHWQGAMSWIRDNTDANSVFSHWWDYGYWVQTLGGRATIADGGHFQGAEDGNHKIGRYILTTPNPKTAYSYFKSMGVTHLLIDPTDLGKYPAYSKIGSNDEWDRFSSIPTGTYNPAQITETSDSKSFVYNIQGIVDEDINYDTNGDGKTDIFLPGPVFDQHGNPSAKSYMIGILYSIKNGSIGQPSAAYYHNGKQVQIPVRYVYFNGKILDYENGLDAVAYIFPSISQSSSGLTIDPMGAAIYLSPKVQKSLFARVYLMDNVFKDYDYLTLVHAEYDPVVSSLKNQNAQVGEFVYFQGFRGPIKIWETGYPDDTPVIKEMYELFDGGEQGFGSLDVLFED
jgi:asparagine N-glycosylation enzyme membrane subunit Stt3